MKKIVILAGDKSGDLYGGFLCQHLKEKFPDLEIYSFGGAHLAKHSCQVINLLSHSVSGLVEVIGSLKKILKIFKQTLAEIEQIKPDLIIPIDFPDFNLRLIKSLNKKYPVFYYISPQIWAWRKKRIELIRKYVDKMVTIFKFEQEFYKTENIDALYFGHPLLEVISLEPIKPKKIISFLPGSRVNELKKHLKVIAETKSILEKELPGYCFQIIRPENLAEKLYSNLAQDLKIVPHSYQALAESEFIITSSGTATVEIAILGVPYLVIYKVNSLTWYLIKKLVKTKFAAMVNILANQKVVDELLQDQATAPKICQKALYYLKNPNQYQALKSKLILLKEKLAPNQALSKFADFIGEYLNLSS